MKIIYLILISLLLSGCFSSGNLRIKSDIERSKKILGEELFNHYPIKLSSKHIRFSTNVNFKGKLGKHAFGVNETFLTCRYSKEDYSLIKTKYNSLESLKHDNPYLIYVFSYADKYEIEGDIYENRESPEKRKIGLKNKVIQNGIPVPLLDFEELGSRIFVDRAKYEFKVIECKKGKFNTDLIYYEADWLPEDWKHGYTRGIAFNDNKQIAIYWICVW